MKILLPLFSLSILLSACSFMPAKDAGPQTIALVGPDKEVIEIVVEIADEVEERAQGLMGRETLPPDHGMLFLFEYQDILTFWMKDTLIPLDILFFDSQGNLVSTSTMQPCTEDPCSKYSSSVAAGIALEVNAGFIQANDIGAGWRIALKDEDR